MQLRTFRSFAVAFVALGMYFSAALSVQAQEPLRWKFEKGQKLDYNMVQDTSINTGGGPLGDQKVTMRQEMEMKWDITDITSDGDALVRQKFDRVKMKMTLPVGALEYDSKSETPPAGPAAMLAPLYKALTENDFELTMTPRGEITDVKIPENLITALKNSPGAAAMGDLATPEGFKKMMSQSALVLPEKAPQPNEQWTTSTELNNPMGMKQIVETTYRYEGTKEIDGVNFAVFKPSLKMNFAGENSPKITAQESSGEILFNTDAGRMHSSKLDQDIAMEQAAGIQTKIEQTITVEVTPAKEASEGASAPAK